MGSMRTFKFDLSCFHISIQLKLQTLVVYCSEILALFKTLYAKRASGNPILKFLILLCKHSNSIMIWVYQISQIVHKLHTQNIVYLLDKTCEVPQ